MAVAPAALHIGVHRYTRRPDLRPLCLTVLLLLASAGRAAAQCPAAPDPCVISATQDVSGGLDIGNRDLTIAAGVRLNVVSGTAYSITAGNVTLETGSKIVAPGIDVTVLSSGAITVKSTAVIDTGVDDDGGPIALTSSGDVTLDGSLDAHGGGDGGSGGDVDVTSTGGNVLLRPGSSINGTAKSFGLGSTVTVVGGDITASGTIDVSAGDEGGGIELTAAGQLTLTAVTGKLDASATDAGGDGGDIALSAPTGMTVAGAIISRSSGNNTDGSGLAGSVRLTSTGDIVLSGPIDLTGPAPDGLGGELVVTADGFTMSGKLDAPGKGPDGFGGFVNVTTTGDASLGPMDLSGGSTGGGRLDVTADGDVLLANELNADGANGGRGGHVTVRAHKVTVAGNIHADRLANTGRGGEISLHGCMLVVASAAQVSALGLSGQNTLRANDTMSVNGTVTAGGRMCLSGQNASRSCTNEADCPPPPLPLPGPRCGEGGVTVVEYATTPPSLAKSPVPTPVPAGGTLIADLIPCTGPLPTTTTTTTTSFTTTTGPSTTVTSTSSTTSLTAGTTVSSTTSTSRSTTTSTSRTTTTIVGTSSTTTSTIPACIPGVSGACNDGDGCTDDSCVDGACLNVPAQDVAAITCRLDAIVATLHDANPADLGGSRPQSRLLGKADAVRRTIQAAGTPGTARARRKFKRAGHQLQAVINAVTRGTKRGTIAAGIGNQVLADAGAAKAKLLPFQKPPGAGGAS